MGSDVLKSAPENAPGFVDLLRRKTGKNDSRVLPEGDLRTIVPSESQSRRPRFAAQGCGQPQGTQRPTIQPKSCSGTSKWLSAFAISR